LIKLSRSALFSASTIPQEHHRDPGKNDLKFCNVTQNDICPQAGRLRYL